MRPAWLLLVFALLAHPAAGQALQSAVPAVPVGEVPREIGNAVAALRGDSVVGGGRQHSWFVSAKADGVAAQSEWEQMYDSRWPGEWPDGALHSSVAVSAAWVEPGAPERAVLATSAFPHDVVAVGSSGRVGVALFEPATTRLADVGGEHFISAPFHPTTGSRRPWRRGARRRGTRGASPSPRRGARQVGHERQTDAGGRGGDGGGLAGVLAGGFTCSSSLRMPRFNQK